MFVLIALEHSSIYVCQNVCMESVDFLIILLRCIVGVAFLKLSELTLRPLFHFFLVKSNKYYFLSLKTQTRQKLLGTCHWVWHTLTDLHKTEHFL